MRRRGTAMRTQTNNHPDQPGWGVSQLFDQAVTTEGGIQRCKPTDGAETKGQ
jgi:hypothetical protein